MSSVEIVDVINALRGPGKAEMKHNDFMKKVREHPGINEGNFSFIYFDQLGREKPCYYLPKREAELMVMSESLEVQTKVYDRLTELEAAAVPKLPQTYAQALMGLVLHSGRSLTGLMPRRRIVPSCYLSSNHGQTRTLVLIVQLQITVLFIAISTVTVTQPCEDVVFRRLIHG